MNPLQLLPVILSLWHLQVVFVLLNASLKALHSATSQNSHLHKETWSQSPWKKTAPGPSNY